MQRAAPEEAFWPHTDNEPDALCHTKSKKKPAAAASSYADRYERLGKIGEGAFGEVAGALDRLTGRVVAVKSVRLGNDPEKGGCHASIQFNI